MSRIMGLDIGLKRTGVAISDENQSISLPRSVIEATDKQTWLSKVRTFVENEDIEKIVVGIPLNQHGEEGTDAQKIRQFIALLQERLNVPVIEWDERFTTAQAERSMIAADLSRAKRKKIVDKVAATILLQSYLDSLRFSEHSPCDES
ncbi:MAG: Holliday junction resolvase RuvX [Deltaproteobacteria bacterium]|nr:Holliday junction resolvase RuvX [Deltaproteobacteria bacterium]